MVKRNPTQHTQKHHISYEPEIIVTLYKGEHWAITQLNRRTKKVSKGFIKCIKAWIEEVEPITVDLDEMNNED